jgi:hypothetical protein
MITNQDKLACVERELAFRNRVYARLITRGKMSPNEARRETMLMEAIVEDYRALVAADEPEFTLFVETRR